jgi:serine/threonine protein kinase
VNQSARRVPSVLATRTPGDRITPALVRTLLQVLNHRRPDAELRRRFPLARLLGAFQQVCLAVDDAHKHGVLHRDI